MLTLRALLWRNLLYYRRTNFAVICGVVAATAVISGALIVGDSVRFSLRQMTLDRLGRIDHVVQSQRFFREVLADEVARLSPEVHGVAPALVVEGTVELAAPNGDKRRAGQVSVYGCDDRLWSMLDHGDVSPPMSGQIVLNSRVADSLNVKVGDQVSLVVELPSAIPRDALLGKRNESIAAQPMTVSAIVPDDQGVARLGLNPTQQLPANAYVALGDLQTQMGLQAVARSRRNPFEKPARVNTLFFWTATNSKNQDKALSAQTAEQLQRTLDGTLQLTDFGLRIVEDAQRKYVSLESEQMFLEPAISRAAEETAQSLMLRTSPVLVSLINEVWKPSTPEKYSMYSVVAGFTPADGPPFGPFEFVDESRPLTGHAAYLNEWLADDLQAAVGDTIQVKYYQVGDRGELPEEEAEFVVAGIVKLTGAADDRGFTPNVPGVTDADSYAEWDEPFPLKKSRITARDDSYWDEYRTTPKMFVSLEAAQARWKSRYGELTSLRLAPLPGQSLSQLRNSFSSVFLERLHPQSLGIAVQPVKLQGLMAANGSTDFTGLFIGFSFFLILSAAMLTGLLFRLGIDLRLSEMGLLQAVGLSPRQVRSLLFREGLVLVTIGTLLGTLAAVGYAALMIYGLKTWWIGAIGTRFLFLDVEPQSLVLGGIIAISVAVAAIWWGQRQALRETPRALLSGASIEPTFSRHPWLASILATVCLGGASLLAVAGLLGMIPDVEAFGGFSWRIVTFFLVGCGMLTGCLAAFAVLLGSERRQRASSLPTLSIPVLAMRNASRNRTRSMLTVSLIASATFVIVAVAAGQMNPVGAKPNPRSGNGGFTLVAETSLPVLYDLNTAHGRTELGLTSLSDQQQELLNKAKFAPFRMRAGENASCLNLFQTQLPTILGVPDDVLDMLISEDRFVFADTPAKHPWELLREKLPTGHVPVLGDMNTLMYSLHKGIGQTIPVVDDAQPEQTLQVVGMLANSVLQGVLIMSESEFRRLFPDQVGFRYFLIDVDPVQAPELTSLLESQLGDYGFDVDRVSQRMADFLAVQNTYLSTFQTLGGLGLLLGTLGLATVMLRNVLERAGEFALLQAVGLQKTQIASLVAWETALLLGFGLLAGTVSALIAMSPHLRTSVASIPWFGLTSMLLGILLIGMLAALTAVRAAVRLPILQTLRDG